MIVMIRSVLGIGLLALGAAACSPPAPPPASTTAKEIAALEKELKQAPEALPRIPAPTAGALAFARQADEAVRCIDARTDVAECRGLVTELRAGAQTPAEKNVALLTTAMMLKQQERQLALTENPDNRSQLRTLERSATECLAEAEEWIKALRGEVEILEPGRCLRESQERPSG